MGITSILGGPRPAGTPVGAATQITTTELPSEFKPFITDIFEKAKAQQEGLEYTPYPGARLAPFGPLQQEAFTGLTDLVRQGVVGAPDTSSAFYAQEALEAARRAGRPIEAADIERLTNPYQQQVIDIAKREAERSYETTVAPQIEQQAVAAGSYGGSRGAILESEGLKNLQQQLSDIQMKGSAQAYQQAQKAYEQEATRARGLQGFMQQQFGQVPSQAVKELGVLQSVGEAQQLLDQKALNLGYEDFLEEREFPTRSLQEYQASIRGFPYTPAAYQYTQQTAPTPSLGQTLLTAGAQGLGMYGTLGGFGFGAPPQKAASGGQIRGGLSGLVESHQNNTFGDRYRAGMGLGPGQKFGGERHGGRSFGGRSFGGRSFGGRSFGGRSFGGHRFGEQEIDPRSLINMLYDPELTEDEQQLIQEKLKDMGIRSTEDLWGKDEEMVQFPLVPGATIAANPNIEMVTMPAVSPTPRLRPPPSIPSITSPQIDQLNQRIKSLEQQGVLDAASILEKQRDELIDQIRNAADPVLRRRNLAKEVLEAQRLAEGAIYESGEYEPLAISLSPVILDETEIPSPDRIDPTDISFDASIRRLMTAQDEEATAHEERLATLKSIYGPDSEIVKTFNQYRGSLVDQGEAARLAYGHKERLRRERAGDVEARITGTTTDYEQHREDLAEVQGKIGEAHTKSLADAEEAKEKAAEMYRQEQESLRNQRSFEVAAAFGQVGKIPKEEAGLSGFQGFVTTLGRIASEATEAMAPQLRGLTEKERKSKIKQVERDILDTSKINEINLGILNYDKNVLTELRELNNNYNQTLDRLQDQMFNLKVTEVMTPVEKAEALSNIRLTELDVTKQLLEIQLTVDTATIAAAQAKTENEAKVAQLIVDLARANSTRLPRITTGDLSKVNTIITDLFKEHPLYHTREFQETLRKGRVEMITFLSNSTEPNPTVAMGDAIELLNQRVLPDAVLEGEHSTFSVLRENIPIEYIGDFARARDNAINEGGKKDVVEKHYIREFIQQFGGNEQQARRILGWS